MIDSLRIQKQTINNLKKQIRTVMSCFIAICSKKNVLKLRDCNNTATSSKR